MGPIETFLLCALALALPVILVMFRIFIYLKIGK